MQEHEIWFAWANRDLNCARALLALEEAEIPGALYHCQQCIEKALKSYLLLHEHKIIRTHDLGKLLEECLQFDKELITLQTIVSDLDPFITGGRYPDSAFLMPDITTAQILFSQTQEAFNFIKRKME